MSDVDADCGFCGYVGGGFRVGGSDAYGNVTKVLICPECEQVCETYARLLLWRYAPGISGLASGSPGGSWATLSRKAPEPLIPAEEQKRLDALPVEVDPDDPATWPAEARP